MPRRKLIDDGEPYSDPTWYGGTLFRSRLESLWAKAFDRAGPGLPRWTLQ